MITNRNARESIVFKEYETPHFHGFIHKTCPLTVFRCCNILLFNMNTIDDGNAKGAAAFLPTPEMLPMRQPYKQR